MDQDDVLAERFEVHRPRLRAVAYQTLGSASEADDAVQETWLRLSRSDPGNIENLGGWLTTVVARVCLNMLQSRRDEPVGMHLPETVVSDADGVDPETEALLAESIGPALLVILHTLTPAERLAFVLHDMFAVPFDDIAPIVGRSPAAARQLASRARRRVQGVAPVLGTDLTRQRAIADAFLTAARNGDFDALPPQPPSSYATCQPDHSQNRQRSPGPGNRPIPPRHRDPRPTESAKRSRVKRSAAPAARRPAHGGRRPRVCRTRVADGFRRSGPTAACGWRSACWTGPPRPARRRRALRASAAPGP